MKMPRRRPWGQRMERVLIGVVAAVAAVVVIAQSVVNDPLNRAATPVASLERSHPPLKNSEGVTQNSIVTLQLKNFSSLPLARVLVNGEPRGEFRDRYVSVFVREGDLLEVDGTRYSRPLDFEVLDVSRGVILPAAGTKVRVEGSVSSLGQVRLSH